MFVTLLAQRLRVEERQLIAAFAERGYDATLSDPARIGISVQASAEQRELVLDRGVATLQRATLGALLAANGATVVNRTATTRLLADRLALFRHLIIAGIPVPETIACFGEAAAYDALATIGYPAFILTSGVDLAVPDAVIADADAGEAIVEHRTTLGPSALTLVQRFIEGDTIRLVVVGDSIVAVEKVNYAADGSVSYASFDADTVTVHSIGNAVVGRLGSGTYAVKVAATSDRSVVVGVSNLVDFRSLTDAGLDVAGLIAEYAISQCGIHHHQQGE